MATWQYANIYRAIAQTLAMAFLGTLLGTIGSLFVGLPRGANVMPIALVRQGVRRFLDVLRGIDQLVWGLVFVRAVGLGPLAGVLAIFVSDLGTLSKLYSEAIENIDRKQVEGVKATGAGPIAVIRYGYLPQVLPVFISQSLYFWESNTRSATILGIVGAGGIGMILIERFRRALRSGGLRGAERAGDHLRHRLAVETHPPLGHRRKGALSRARPLRPKRGRFVCACNRAGRGANLAPMVIDGLQYANWSEKVFRQMREGGVDAVHVTIAYHEMFRETVANIEAWNRRFERFPDLICHAKTGDDIRRAKDRGAHRHRLRRPDARAHRGRYRAGGDPAHARPALHAAELQQPVPARDRLLRGGGSRASPAWGARSSPR
jgi:ABC-type methionine transport system permease subunit